jgi:lipopolysaccharide transport system ATP-binding protein
MLALSVRNLGKSYTIRQRREQYGTLLETALQRMRSPRLGGETFWALKNLSFDVQQGEVLGIIGHNGAGKSTLLKVLSRITMPTTGEVDLYGRVGSLIELGAGMHPDMTGRENIYLYGSMLGMTRREIDAQYDAIIDFTGFARFLETPMKHYASGMYARLAFAVAAHLNPEILIVDEVLAVGDAEFQKKCLGKMHDVAKGGRTVLFVSHQLQSVRQLCTRALVLEKGSMVYEGDVPGAIAQYLRSVGGSEAARSNPEARSGTGEYRLISVTPEKAVMDSEGEKRFTFLMRRRSGNAGRLYLSAHIVNHQGAVVAQCDSRLTGTWLTGDEEEVEGTFRFTTPWLKPGSYHLDVAICTTGIVVDDWAQACDFDISPLLPYDQTISSDGIAEGIVFADFAWDIQSTR